MLILSRKINESIIVGDSIEIKLIDITSKVVKIGINAPKEISVHRKEIYDAIKKENLLAISPLASERVVSLFDYYNKFKKLK